MVAVLTCPSCNRPSGPKFARCMYCGADLPAVQSAESPGAPPPGDLQAEADKARGLLAGLSPAARAMMPAAVIQKLEAAVAAGDAEADHEEVGDQSGSTITAEIAIPDLPGPAPATPETIFDVPEPSPDGDPSIPEVDALNLETFDIASLGEVQLEPYVSVKIPALEPKTVPAAAKAPATSEIGDLDAALRTGMGRGGGPFGRREEQARVLLLPSPDYKARAHWLKHRLKATLDIDLYTAGQALQRDVPVFLCGADTWDDAQGLADLLRESGLRVLTIERHHWVEGAEPERVVSAATDGPGGDVRFERLDGSSFAVARTDFSWAALGEITPDSDKIPMVAERSKRWGTAVAPSGRTLDVDSGPFTVLDILRRSTRRPIRIRSDRFDFACLGDQRGLAALLNLRRLLTWISPSPEAPVRVDDRFKRVPHVTASAVLEVEVGPSLSRREIEFTEYVLLTDAPNHL